MDNLNIRLNKTLLFYYVSYVTYEIVKAFSDETLLWRLIRS